jgi:hypothetical protein
MSVNSNSMKRCDYAIYNVGLNAKGEKCKGKCKNQSVKVVIHAVIQVDSETQNFSRSPDRRSRRCMKVYSSTVKGRFRRCHWTK